MKHLDVFRWALYNATNEKALHLNGIEEIQEKMGELELGYAIFWEPWLKMNKIKQSLDKHFF